MSVVFRWYAIESNISIHSMIKDNSIFTVNYATAIDKTMRFWKNVGVDIKEETNDKLVIVLAGIELHYILETTEPFEHYMFAIEKLGRGRGVLFYFSVDDIVEFHKTIKSQNPPHITQIEYNHWGAQEFLFSDPDGYLFVAYQ